MMLNREVFVISLLVLLVSCQKVIEYRTPNIIIVFTDDQGYQDLGCFGSADIQTPHIDRLAADGARLTDFSVAQPVCSASRAALLTGCYPNRLGLWGALMPQAQRGLSEEETTIAELLQDKGYKTGIFGKWHLGVIEHFSPLKHGFDEFFGIPYSNDMWPNHPSQGSVFNFPPLPLYDNDEVVDILDDQSNLTRDITFRVIDFIERNRDQSFFAYVPHPQPHVPLYVSDNFKGKSEAGLYGDVIMEIDWSVGQIVDALERNGVAENTIVIFTSDNGPWLSYGSHAGSALPLREGKGTAWEGGVREPFVIKYPKEIKAGTVVTTPLMSIDLLPSLVHVAEAKLPSKKIDGLNTWDIFKGASVQNPHEAYYYYYHKNEMHAVRDKDWKLYFPHRYRTIEDRVGLNNGLPIDYTYNTLEEPELYNLSEDISEQNNVIDDHPEVVKRLEMLADEMRIDLGDELMKIEGRGQRPSGLIVDKDK